MIASTHALSYGLSSVISLPNNEPGDSQPRGCNRKSYFRLYLVLARRDTRDETKLRGDRGGKECATFRLVNSFPGRRRSQNPVMYERAKVAHPGAARPRFSMCIPYQAAAAMRT